MRQYPDQYLPARPAFLLASQLPYDDLLKSPGSFARRLCGLTLHVGDPGCEAPFQA
jgi:hypothetical protein